LLGKAVKLLADLWADIAHIFFRGDLGVIHPTFQQGMEWKATLFL